MKLHFLTLICVMLTTFVLLLVIEKQDKEIKTMKESIKENTSTPQELFIKEPEKTSSKVYVCDHVWDDYHKCYVSRYILMDRDMVDYRAIIGSAKR